LPGDCRIEARSHHIDIARPQQPPFLLAGDGALDYRSERIAETYYNWKLAKHFQLSLDYQLIQNPAYNHVRGPVDFFALRFHTEI